MIGKVEDAGKCQVRWSRPVLLGLVLCGAWLQSCSAAQPAAEVDWRYYGADAASTRYAPLPELGAENFAQLQEVWRYRPPDLTRSRQRDANRGTPLVVNGVLYYGSPLNILCAVDAATGRELWTFDPESWRQGGTFVGNMRGIAYWTDGRLERLFFGTASDRLYSVDVATGQPDPAFGQGGFVDLAKGLRRPVNRANYGVSSPPIVCRDIVVIGSSMVDWRGRTPPQYTNPGDVRGFDARSGRQVWTFQTIPQAGQFGNETWENDAWQTYGAANVWAAMSADPELGLVYLPVSTVSHDFYGGERPGANLFSESLVCLEAATGRRVWHFQLVHHGLWDYDPPAPPILLNIEVEGKPVQAVALVTKQAFCYVFDRVSGQPLWPIEERPVPQSEELGERSAPTQPFPTKPAPFDLQGITVDDLIDFTPQLRQRALNVLTSFEHGPLYTPPSQCGTIVMPGFLGGADWAGATAHPDKGMLYIPSHTLPSVVWLQPTTRAGASSRYRAWGDDGNAASLGDLPLTKPPYGRITAIDMHSGEHAWMKPVGRGPADHPALRHLDLPDLGWATRTFALTTPELLITASQAPGSLGGGGGREQPLLRAFNLNTGAQTAQAELPAHANGGPMAYRTGGRVFIVVPIGGRGGPAELVALSLP
ncbi:MAG: PQQ-binding-like beta-propeller repeat protein [Candidatus Latescibacteria bacterium]|nr:PQQ-binding-like beta-propeller repeat protein [Candidatus Latescibacterota bacterium]